ncbi:MAG: hypothetical protein HZB39_18775 [Planctomycetes bacterium]|nr:hypothetical protein [Planctomycetota bacterium]
MWLSRLLVPRIVVLFGAALAAQAEVSAPVEPLPAAVDLRAEIDRLGIGPRSQGVRPTCSVFTVVSTLELALARVRGEGLRLSPEFANRAKNLATGRVHDGGFFHDILAGLAREGIVRENAMPYAKRFDPEAKAAVDDETLAAEATALRALIGKRLHVVWIKPWSEGTRGLSETQFEAVRRTLANGLAVATGMAHSRTLVGYRDDKKVLGGGVFLTLDSALGRYGEVSYEFVRTELCDVFTFEVLPEPKPAAKKLSAREG